MPPPALWSSFNPTVLMQYPRLQKCSSETFLWPSICRWIRAVLLPLIDHGGKPYRAKARAITDSMVLLKGPSYA